MATGQASEPAAPAGQGGAEAAAGAGRGAQGAQGPGTVQIVDHALMVLKAIAEADRPRGVRELSRDLAISKSSTQRILASLEKVGLAVADEATRKYVVGPAALTLAWKHADNSDLVSAATGTTARIAAVTGETACISTIVDGRRVTVHEAESSQPLRLITGVGRPYSLFSGATGRVLMSLLPADELRRLVGEHVAEGPDETAADRILGQVAEVGANGYALSRSEWIAGGCGVAVPIGRQGSLVAALSIYGPEARLTDERMAELVPALQKAAAEIALRWRQPA
ncbi:IclR family transcriptional regulator [Streptomyces sp. B5E4]|uniref:IclR family transcriptional regulator n=1 Tax=Streptomyces sp. B5E4 TaxID=3153568 RepID=UPI00325F8848